LCVTRIKEKGLNEIRGVHLADGSAPTLITGREAPSERRKLPRGRSAPKGRHEAVSAARVIAITPRSRGTCKTSHASLGRQLLARNTTGRSYLVRAPSPVRYVPIVSRKIAILLRRRYKPRESPDKGEIKPTESFRKLNYRSRVV